jgi:hypothetical protein
VAAKAYHSQLASLLLVASLVPGAALHKQLTHPELFEEAIVVGPKETDVRDLEQDHC